MRPTKSKALERCEKMCIVMSLPSKACTTHAAKLNVPSIAYEISHRSKLFEKFKKMRFICYIK